MFFLKNKMSLVVHVGPPIKFMADEFYDVSFMHWLIYIYMFSVTWMADEISTDL